MSVDIGRVVEEGGQRTLARNGLVLVAIVWVLGVLNLLVADSIAGRMMGDLSESMPFAPPATETAIGISPAIAGLLSFLVSLASLVVGAAALRTFVTDETEAVPGEHFTHNLGWMLLNLIVGGIVFGIVVAVGFVFLIVPGLFLLVSLFFWSAYVIVEDQNFIEGFQNSWALTRGNRLVLFALGVVVVILVAVVEFVFGIPAAVIPGAVGLAVGQIGSAFTTVFAIAAVARTWVQLTAEEPVEEPDGNGAA